MRYHLEIKLGDEVVEAGGEFPERIPFHRALRLIADQLEFYAVKGRLQREQTVLTDAIINNEHLVVLELEG